MIEENAEHALQLFDKYLIVSRMEKTRAKRKDESYKWYKKRKLPVTVRVPHSLAAFTFRQLSYILTDISINYLKDTHIYSFNGEIFLIRLISEHEYQDEPSEFSDKISRRVG